LHPRVIGALLLFASAEFAVAQDVDTEAISGTFANAPAGVETINGYEWIVSYTGGTSNDFVLTAVPEPGTWVAGGLALGGLICYQRRRFARFFKRGP
jgi:hypothetical protein